MRGIVVAVTGALAAIVAASCGSSFSSTTGGGGASSSTGPTDQSAAPSTTTSSASSGSSGGGSGGAGANGGGGANVSASSSGGASSSSGMPAMETNCFDGKDNDKDGATDCKDSDCKAVAGCMHRIPSFDGPYLVAISSSTPGPCPAEYPTSKSYFEITGADPATCNCTCGDPDKTCNLSVALQEAAAIMDCDSVDNFTVDDASSCFPISSGAMLDTHLAGAGKASITNNAPMCAASADSKAPPYETNQVLVCDNLVAGGCNATEKCLPLAQQGFKQCVAAPGNVGCPAMTSYTDKHVVYATGDTVTDTRGCDATACSCTFNNDAKCSGEVSLFTDGACGSGDVLDITVNTQTPSQCMGVSPPALIGSIQYKPDDRGSCNPSGKGVPTGGVVASNPVTICCQ